MCELIHQHQNIVKEHTHHFHMCCTLGAEASIEDIYHTHALCQQHNGIVYKFNQ